jgi:hypothetical protein
MFEHGFEQNLTDGIFIVTHIIQGINITLYRIKDRSDKEITGLFHEQELSKVIIYSSKQHRIGKILKTRKRQGKVEYLVRWSGFSSAFDS